MEKMRTLDGKLKYQIDRLLNLKSMDPQDVKNAMLRPNLASLLDDDEEENANSKPPKSNKNVSDIIKVIIITQHSRKPFLLF